MPRHRCLARSADKTHSDQLKIVEHIQVAEAACKRFIPILDQPAQC